MVFNLETKFVPNCLILLHTTECMTKNEFKRYDLLFFIMTSQFSLLSLILIISLAFSLHEYVSEIIYLALYGMVAFFCNNSVSR